MEFWDAWVLRLWLWSRAELDGCDWKAMAGLGMWFWCCDDGREFGGLVLELYELLGWGSRIELDMLDPNFVLFLWNYGRSGVC